MSSSIHDFSQYSPCTIVALPPYPRLISYFQGFHRLRDWSSVLNSFRAVVNKNAPPAPQTDLPDGSSPLLVLMRLLVRSEVRSHYVNVENNFLYAALHLYALNNGIFPEGIIPNLPGEQKHVQMYAISLISPWYKTLIFVSKSIFGSSSPAGVR